MSIRPITRHLPLSGAVWKETGLPMCAVLTPFEELEEEEDETDAKDDPCEPETDSNHQGVVRHNTFAQPMAAVPKCLHCGAPHPTATTHFRPSKLSSRILCYLCGMTSSTMLTDQQEVREDEYLDPDIYDKIPFLTPRELLEGKKEEDNDDEEEDEDEEATAQTDCIEFRVPIESQKKPNPPPPTTRKGRRSRHPETHEAIVPTWQLPAMACPPVWWIVVDGTVGGNGSTSVGASRNYWTTVGATLARALEEIPPHVHVGLITATGSRLANWDLTSAVPHVKQFPYNYDPMASPLAAASGGGEPTSGTDPEHTTADAADVAWDLCLVPANGHYKANLQAAIRAMVDGAGVGVFRDDSDDDDDDNDEKKGEDEPLESSGRNMPLGLTIEIILDFMEQARHPGQIDDDDDQFGGDDDDRTTQLRYAGGKILCLLGNPPLETATPPTDDSMSYVGQSKYGLGGVAGACRADEDDNVEPRSGRSSKSKRSKAKKQGTNHVQAEDNDLTDMTPSNLKDYVLPLEPEDLFVKIGSRCAQDALGVDLLVLVPEEDDNVGVKRNRFYKDHNEGRIPWYGLPLLRPLSERSGAPGPLMFGTANIGLADDRTGESADAENIEPFERLHENVLARTPWQSGMAFGVQMNMRLSPGFRVESSPIDRKPNTELQLFTFLNSAGLSGPAVDFNDDEEDGKSPVKKDDDDDENTSLWVMGTCDSHTAFVVDLETVGTDELPDSIEMEGFGEVELKPVLQTCTLFTCIETDGAEPIPNYYTVCKMRVSSVSLEYADNAEAIFDGLDQEALSVVLYHKIALEAYTSGLVFAHKTAEMWLQSMMVSLYSSAQAEYASEEEKSEENMVRTNRRHSSPSDDDSDCDTNFVACDRLLDVEGGDLEESEVLLGQGHLKMNALPLLVYAVMNSDALRLCGGNFRPSMDARLCAMTQMASMTPATMTKLLAPSLSLWSLKDDHPILESLPLSREGILIAIEDLDESDVEDTIIFLDSPQGIILFHHDELDDRRGKSVSRSIKIGSELGSEIQTSLMGFRTAPPNWKALESFLDSQGGDLDDIRVSRSALLSMLVEDKSSMRGDPDFIEWKLRMAEEIREYVAHKNESPSGLRRLLPFWKK